MLCVLFLYCSVLFFVLKMMNLIADGTAAQQQEEAAAGTHRHGQQSATQILPPLQPAAEASWTVSVSNGGAPLPPATVDIPAPVHGLRAIQLGVPSPGNLHVIYSINLPPFMGLFFDSCFAWSRYAAFGAC